METFLWIVIGLWVVGLAWFTLDYILRGPDPEWEKLENERKRLR